MDYLQAYNVLLPYYVAENDSEVVRLWEEMNIKLTFAATLPKWKLCNMLSECYDNLSDYKKVRYYTEILMFGLFKNEKGNKEVVDKTFNLWFNNLYKIKKIRPLKALIFLCVYRIQGGNDTNITELKTLLLGKMAKKYGDILDKILWIIICVSSAILLIFKHKQHALLLLYSALAFGYIGFDYFSSAKSEALRTAIVRFITEWFAMVLACIYFTIKRLKYRANAMFS